MDHEPIRHFQNGGPIYDQFVCKWGARPPFTKSSILRGMVGVRGKFCPKNERKRGKLCTRRENRNTIDTIGTKQLFYNILTNILSISCFFFLF